MVKCCKNQNIKFEDFPDADYEVYKCENCGAEWEVPLKRDWRNAEKIKGDDDV